MADKAYVVSEHGVSVLTMTPDGVAMRQVPVTAILGVEVRDVSDDCVDVEVRTSDVALVMPWVAKSPYVLALFARWRDRRE